MVHSQRRSESEGKAAEAWWAQTWDRVRLRSGSGPAQVWLRSGSGSGSGQGRGRGQGQGWGQVTLPLPGTHGLLTGGLSLRLREAPEGVLGVHRAGRPAGLRPGSCHLDGDLQVVSPVFRDQEPTCSPWRLMTALLVPTVPVLPVHEESPNFLSSLASLPILSIFLHF